MYFRSRKNNSACFGTIISKNIIFTQVHCIKDPYSSFEEDFELSSVMVTFGKSDEKTEIAVKSFVIHPDYSNITFENNVALLKLSKDIEFNEYIRPIASQTGNRRTGSNLTDTKITEEIKMLRSFTAFFPVIHKLRNS